jgi:O-antigen/teichoic acid export membrane protein
VATAALGILQTAIILRILSPAQYGIIGIVVSLGSLVGVSQHVGVVDATIREIAVAVDARRRAHVFWVSLWFRLLVTVPISVVFAALGPLIGTRLYPFPDVPRLVQLTSLILILQGIQGVVGGAYTGKLAFGRLYLFQLLMAAVNVPLFAGMTSWHGVRGFFEAVVVSTGAFIVLLALFLREALGGTLVHPRLQEMRIVLSDIVHTGAWTYVARILSVAWQRVPVLLLGWWASPDVVGLFNAALTFGSKLVILASALGEVNLAFLSSAFARSRQAFTDLAKETLEDVGAAVLVGAGFLALFADVLLNVLAGEAYGSAATVTTFVTWAYALFAFLDIAANTVFVPARRAQFRALSFGALFGGTLGTMFFLRATPLLAGGMGTVIGGLFGTIVGEVLARNRMQMTLFSGKLGILLVPGGLLAVGSFAQPSLVLRVALFLCAGGAILWIAFPSLMHRVRRRPTLGGPDVS